MRGMRGFTKGAAGRRMVMQALGVLAFIAVLAPNPVSAEWRMDGNRFLRSAHGGEVACVDCHTDIEEATVHPDPTRMMADQGRVFDAETCYACHDTVEEEVAAGSHGGEEDAEPEMLAECTECHDSHYLEAEESDETPEASFSDDDQACLACHQRPMEDDPQRAVKNTKFCFSCHGDRVVGNVKAPTIDQGAYAAMPHAALDCLECHTNADKRSGHAEQATTECITCHSDASVRHEEKVAHDAHLGVSCQACHLEGVAPIRDAASNDVRWATATIGGTLTNVHQMRISDRDALCARCHFDGTPVGAAAMVLPPKSVMCMPCHTATFSIGDATTLISLGIFLLGFLMTAAFWMGGDMAGVAGGSTIGKAIAMPMAVVRALFSPKIGKISKALYYDVLLQRRLYERSPKRWFIHSLIFLPFVVRFVWGLVALIGTTWMKAVPLFWAMVDKNNPATALVFDITGAMIAIGIFLAFIRGGESDKTRVSGMPQQDRLALVLIGGIVLVGFVLEGMRIALTGMPADGTLAFIGFGFARLVAGMDGLSDIYGYVWYLHAILTGAFVAYLPFSRMMHIIMAPVVLSMKAISEDHH